MKANTLAAVIGLTLALTACNKVETDTSKVDEQNTTSSQQQENSQTQEVITKNPDWPTYIVATDPSNAPYEIRNDQGLVEGFDVDLINAIGQAEGFNIDVIPQSWAGIFESLETGERDILIAPLTINAERDKLVDFTIPYIYPTRTAYLLPETAKKLAIKTYQDLPKGSIAAKKETTNVSSLEEDFGKDNLNIVPVDSQYLALTSVTSGQTDIGFGDTAVLQFHAKAMGDIDFVTIEQTLKTPVEAGFAVKNGNQKLLDVLNSGLRKVIEDGTYRKLAIKWFGEDLGNQVADRTQSHMQE